MRAMTAAPMSPAAPSCAACVDAALLVVAGFVVVELPAEDEADEGVPGVPVVLVTRGVVAAGLVWVVSGVEEVPLALVAPAVVGEVEPVPEEVGFFPTQLVSDPVLTVNGADSAVVPVESRIVRPIDVCAAMLATHVIWVSFVGGKVTRACAPGWPPGRMLT